jgi:hypothetical protein
MSIMRAQNVNSQRRRGMIFYIMQDFRSMVNCSAFYYQTIWRGRQYPSIMIAILLHDPADTDNAIAFIDREFDFIDNIALFVTHRERVFRDHCCSATAQDFVDHCQSSDDDVVDDEYDYDDDEDDDGNGDDGDHTDDVSDNDGEDDQDDDDDDGTSITTAQFVTHQDHGTATKYALALLGMVTPSLLRPVAYQNMAALYHDQYNQVLLPDLNDVQRLLLQREMNRQ